jgi:hypothetical protein
MKTATKLYGLNFILVLEDHTLNSVFGEGINNDLVVL